MSSQPEKTIGYGELSSAGEPSNNDEKEFLVSGSFPQVLRCNLTYGYPSTLEVYQKLMFLLEPVCVTLKHLGKKAVDHVD